jgi:bifunctional UDP-N-acetylglucosamine pyrophosphorylase/glucosamine-1-phosphate N-acetyltransferase
VVPSQAMNQPASGVLPIILAAGLGTRMKSSRPKVLHELCGRPMLAYVLDAADAAAGRRPLVVYSPATAAVVDVFAGRADFVLQAEPLGTADAVRAALAAVPEDVAELLVLSGDVPRVDPEVLTELVELRRTEGAVMALVAVDAVEPQGLGRVIREADGVRVQRIVEEKDATSEELEIDEINAGIYAFETAWLRRRVGNVEPSPVSGELYLPELVALAREDDQAVVSLDVEDDGTLLGINDRAQLAAAERDLQLSINEAHMLAGVTMADPASTYVEPSVELAEDVVLEPGVILRGRTKIGSGTRIGAGSQLVDSVVGVDCLVRASLLEGAQVEDGARIGPFSHLRPGTQGGSGKTT